MDVVVGRRSLQAHRVSVHDTKNKPFFRILNRSLDTVYRFFESVWVFHLSSIQKLHQCTAMVCLYIFDSLASGF